MFVRYSFVGDSRQAHLSFSSHADALGALRTMDAILNGKLITDGTRSVPDFAIALKLDHNQIRFAVATGHDEVTSPNPIPIGCTGGAGSGCKFLLVYVLLFFPLRSTSLQSTGQRVK